MIKDKLNGLKVELESEDEIEAFSFNNDIISATLGAKDGPVSAPILKYEITGEDSILIKGLFPIIWENIVFYTDLVKLKRNGSWVIYNISNLENPGHKKKLP